ncbi:MAG: 30S ribosomal protein S12 methylthiotransferase RimO [Anaerolineaceae bacterium]
MTIKDNTFHIITLGCAKNLVDSTSLAATLGSENMRETEHARQAKYIIVNTCGFIHDAREESLETLREYARKKRQGQYLIAAGCLSQRFQERLRDEVQGIDGMIGTRNLKDIISLTRKLKQGKPDTGVLDHGHILYQQSIPSYAVQGTSAYLKIADGCRRACAFCAIPLIKGTLVSREREAIIQDAVDLQANGTKEINLIAQDVTDYQYETGRQDALADLLTDMIPRLPDVRWLRLLYTFPGYVSDRLADLMAADNQLLPYLDMPLQHADPNVLLSMNRPSNMDWVRNLINKLRARVPHLVTRTTLIVGFPTETDQAFETLKQFVQEIQFDRVGVFTYSPEVGTPAEKLGDPIPEAIKQARLAELMEIQAGISYRKNQTLIGQTFDLLVEGVDPSQNVLIGRTWREAPEVDGLVIASGKALVGEMTRVKITGALEHDLYGQQI